MFPIHDIDTIKKLFERGEKAVGRNFSYSNLFIHMRDTFHGNIKYGDFSMEEKYEFVKEEPILESDVEYTFASAYTAWICSQYDIPLPEWCQSKRSFKYVEYMLTIYNTEPDIIKAWEHPVKPFTERGWFVNEYDLSIV